MQSWGSLRSRSACRGARSSRTNLGDINDDLIPGVTAAVAQVDYVPRIGVVLVPLGAGESRRFGTMRTDWRPRQVGRFIVQHYWRPFMFSRLLFGPCR